MKIICSGCCKEMDNVGQIHEIFDNQFDRFPELCGQGIEITEEDNLAQQQDSADGVDEVGCTCKKMVHRYCPIHGKSRR